MKKLLNVMSVTLELPIYKVYGTLMFVPGLDLGTSGLDLGTSGLDLGTSGLDLGTSGLDPNTAPNPNSKPQS